MEGVDAAAFLDEVAKYNAAVRTDIPYNPNVKDGRRTEGLAFDKTNWAHRIDEGPFEAYQTTCGITFTFGGLRIDDEGAVLAVEEQERQRVGQGKSVARRDKQGGRGT